MRPAAATEPTALLVIDPPNEPPAGGGAFASRHVDPRQLARALAHLVAGARQQGRPVVRVTSALGEAALRDALAATKARRLLLAGVATDGAVLATARAALTLGCAVGVLADATAARTEGRHGAALREVGSLGGAVLSWAEALSEGDAPVAVTGLGSGDTTLWCGALREAIADGPETYEALEREVAWAAMRHRGGEVPRLVAVQGERGPAGAEVLYRHPVDGQPPVADWTPAVDAIRRAAEARVGHPLNHCLLQLYRHGRDWISEHSDKTLDLARPSSIVNVSLGRTRTMSLRPKRDGDRADVERVPLPHGSMLVMGLGTNRARYHSIRQEGARADEGARISLTFRCIGTRHDPATGAVWGVGAPTDDRGVAEDRARERAALAPDERERRDRDESERMLRLFRDENVDPDFDAARYRPGFEVVDLRALNADS